MRPARSSRPAATLAGAFGSRVILVHVAEPVPDFVGYDPGPLSVRVAVTEDIQAAKHRLEELKKKFGGADVLALHIQGSIPDEILALAIEQAADAHRDRVAWAWCAISPARRQP